MKLKIKVHNINIESNLPPTPNNKNFSPFTSPFRIQDKKIDGKF